LQLADNFDRLAQAAASTPPVLPEEPAAVMAVDDMTVQHNVAVSHLQIHSGALPGEVAAVLGLGGLGYRLPRGSPEAVASR
jgi:hypothetical protein